MCINTMATVCVLLDLSSIFRDFFFVFIDNFERVLINPPTKINTITNKLPKQLGLPSVLVQHFSLSLQSAFSLVSVILAFPFLFLEQTCLSSSYFPAEALHTSSNIFHFTTSPRFYSKPQTVNYYINNYTNAQNFQGIISYNRNYVCHIIEIMYVMPPLIYALDPHS